MYKVMTITSLLTFSAINESLGQTNIILQQYIHDLKCKAKPVTDIKIY